MVSHNQVKSQRSKVKGNLMNRKVIIVSLIFLMAYIVYKNIAGSVYLKTSNRLNLVFYNKSPVFYSLGFGDIDYYLPFSSNIQMTVPGGYGLYRVGAIDKLVSLEKKPELIQRTFSSATSSFVDLYFYPQHTMIYYENNPDTNKLPSWQEIFLYKSNANFVDRVVLWYYFIKKNIGQYKIISDSPMKEVDHDSLFDRGGFLKTHQGYFYRQTYRNEKLHVQILYTNSYKTAELIGNLLDGEGIRVVDLSQTDTVFHQCVITYAKDSYKTSATVNALHSFFGCVVRKGNIDVSDIIVVLGDLEKEWLVDF